MGSPIRCLDELYVTFPQYPCFFVTYPVSSDVYMDHINRKMAIDMLVSRLTCETLRFQVINCFLQMIAARRSIGRQFILITPGTKTDITIAPDVRVKELAEPERGQTTLAFQR